MSNTARVLSALQNGEELTAKQIQHRFGVTSARGIVHYLRNEGHAIYLNKRVDSKGRVKNKYRLGTPSKSLIAAGYRALTAGI